MNNKVLVNLYVPLIEKQYEVFLPANKTIGELIFMIGKSLSDVSGGYYVYKETECLYNRFDGKQYPSDVLLKSTNIRNGSDVIFI